MPAGGPGRAPDRAPAVAVVLTGGTARRFGADKTVADLGGTPVLRRLLTGLPADLPVILVGPDPGPALPRRPLAVVRETPAGGGPVAGLAAGCAAAPPDTLLVVALAGDQPFAGGAVPRLLGALERPDLEELDGAIGVGPDGRRQPLLAAYRMAALRAALGPRPAGRAVREILTTLRLAEVPLSAAEALDVDTPADLARAEALLADLDRPGPAS